MFDFSHIRKKSMKKNRLQLTSTKELYSLLEYLSKEEGLETKFIKIIEKTEKGILYILEEEIEKVFNKKSLQTRPLSLFITSPHALDLIGAINSHGFFLSELKKWNPITHQARILITPNPLLDIYTSDETQPRTNYPAISQI